MTSLGSSPRIPKESSAKSRFPTAREIAAEIGVAKAEHDEPAIASFAEPAGKMPPTKPVPKAARVPKPPAERSDVLNRRLRVLAAVIGAIGLTFSLILAFGALFVALGAGQGSGFFAHLSDVCDALVGPLKSLFGFSGANGAKKQTLVAWGLGSMAYLLLGRFVQSVVLSRIKD